MKRVTGFAAFTFVLLLVGCSSTPVQILMTGEWVGQLDGTPYGASVLNVVLNLDAGETDDEGSTDLSGTLYVPSTDGSLYIFGSQNKNAVALLVIDGNLDSLLIYGSLNDTLFTGSFDITIDGATRTGVATFQKSASASVQAQTNTAPQGTLDDLGLQD